MGRRRKPHVKRKFYRREKKRRSIQFLRPEVAIFAEESLLRHRLHTSRGHDLKDFAEKSDGIGHIAPRLCMMSLTHTGGLLDIRKSHLRAVG